MNKAFQEIYISLIYSFKKIKYCNLLTVSYFPEGARGNSGSAQFRLAG